MENNPVTAPDEDSDMMDISSNEVDVGNSTSMALAKSINLSHLDPLPGISDTIGNSIDSVHNTNKRPPLKETARSLRAKRNLLVTAGKHQHSRKRHHHHHRHHHSPSPSRSPGIDSDANELEEESPLNEESHGDDDGPPSSKEASPLLDVPDTSNKRHHSSSPVPGTKLGSKANPIDVDSVASLFEPKVTREYVRIFIFYSAYAEYRLQMKKESISLPLEANPPIKGNRSFTVYDVEGNPKSFTPSFHVRY